MNNLFKQGTTMKTYKLISTLIIALSAYSISASAHDPKEHAKENKKQAPNCAAMQDMEQGKKDKNDPVMMAMMKKCHKMQDGKNVDDKHMDNMEEHEMKKDNHHEQNDDSQH
jgi:hypothetical protein